MSWKQYFFRLLNLSNKLNPYWLCFCFFSLSNIFVAYGRGDLETNLFVAFYGIIVPGIFSLYLLHRNTSFRDGDKKQIFITDDDSISTPPFFLWLSFWLLLLITRFYKLESIPFWPIKDDGHFSILGIALSQKWNWQILWGECQSEPLILWMLGLYFKFIEPSIYSVRFFSALISIVSVLLGYWAARQFFTKSFSFLFAFFLAFGFWSFFYSRICIGAITVFPLQFAVFGMLGVSLKYFKRTSAFRITDILILGVLSGLGFYTYTVWPVVFLSVFIILISKAFEAVKKLRIVLFYSLVVLMTAFPIVLARLGQGGVTHIQDELRESSPFRLTADYFIMFFWNGLKSAPGGPIWGGIFNPIEGALIFIGLLRLGMSFKNKFSKWFFFSGFLLILPGILGNTLDICHVTQLLPLLSISLVIGLEKLAANISKDFRLYGVGLLLFITLVLNIYNWLVPSQDWKSLPLEKNDWTPVEYAKAYEVLHEMSLKNGPLYVFSEFNLHQFNKTLNVACYPFDALQNPKLYQCNPLWSALIINKYYVPFLKKRYPQSQWVLLKKDDIRYHSDLVLGAIPTHSMSPRELDDWKKADSVCRDINLQIKMKTPPVSWIEFKNLFSVSLKVFEKDRFLSAVFWEKTALLDANRVDYEDTAQDFKRSIQFGYPAANLYYNLEMTLERNGQVNEAKRVLIDAIRAQRRFSSSEPAL